MKSQQQKESVKLLKVVKDILRKWHKNLEHLMQEDKDITNKSLWSAGIKHDGEMESRS